MPTFVTTFTPPAEPGGFEIAADIDASAMRLTWDPSVIAQVDFAGFRVYRSLDNGLTRQLLTVLPLTTDVSFDDFQAPLNIPVIYYLTQSNLDFESDPVEAGASLESSRWWVVVPNDSALTFGIAKLRGADLTSTKVQDVFSPAGRPSKVAVGDVVQAEDGSLSFLVLPDVLGMVAIWKAVQARMEGGIILKATDGSVWEVQYGDMSRRFTPVGMQEITIPFVGVG